MADQAMPYMARREEPGEVLVDGHQQSLFIDAGRTLVLGGALLVISNVGSPAAPPAFLGLAMLLLGVCLLALSPVARGFPIAARVGAAVANAVLNYFFPPPN